jgi:nucleoside 2-deoxyribosyltransferase
MENRIGNSARSGEVKTSQIKDNEKEPKVMRVYLAGPDVFFPNAVEIGEAKKRICAIYSIEGVYPLDAHFDVLFDLDSPVDMGHTTFDLMVELMDSCDFVIANLTPFRGPSMDVGTAVEIGYMYGCGKPVFGYTNVVKDYAERVEPDDFFVESFRLVDNVMVEGPVFRSGAVVIRADVPPDEIYTSLAGFTECVRQAAEILSSQQT